MFDSPLEAYFDESGTHNSSNIVTVGGFLSTRNRWQAFVDEWRLFLRNEGVKVFHRTDLEGFRKEFSRNNGWDEQRRNRAFVEAQLIIGKHVMFGCSDSVLKRDYQQAMTDVEDWIKKNMGRAPYTYCGLAAIWNIANWADLLGHNEEIHFFFESGADAGPELDMLMKQSTKRQLGKAVLRCSGIKILKKYDELVGNVLFLGRPQFHAADLVAYEGFKRMQGIHEGISKFPQSLDHLLAMGKQIQHKHHALEDLEFMVKCYRRGTVPWSW